MKKNLLFTLLLSVSAFAFAASGPSPYVQCVFGPDNTSNSQSIMATYELGTIVAENDPLIATDDQLYFWFRNNLDFYESFGSYISHEWILDGVVQTSPNVYTPSPDRENGAFTINATDLSLGDHLLHVKVKTCVNGCYRYFYYNFKVYDPDGPAIIIRPTNNSIVSGEIIEITDLSGNSIWETTDDYPIDFRALNKNTTYIKVSRVNGKIVKEQFQIIQ